MEYSLSSKRKGIQTFAVVWMSLENIPRELGGLIRTTLCDCTGVRHLGAVKLFPPN